MTLTFNPEKYSNLLAHYQPKSMKNELDNERHLAILKQLMHPPNPRPEEDELHELLITLKGKF
jgi:hypothetical protein